VSLTARSALAFGALAASLSLTACADYAAEEPKPRKTAQEKWDERVGQDWQSFVDSFAEGASLACSSFFNTDNGKLYASGDQNEWVVEDCEGLDTDNPESATYVDVPFERPGTPEQAGMDAGIENACSALFDVAGVDEFAWGTDRFTVDDCIGASGFSSQL